MKKNVALYLFTGFIIIIPYLYLLLAYDTLPQLVPTHFDLNGKPNAISHKAELWSIISTTAFISLVIFLLLRFLPSIDPKKKAKYSAQAFIKLGVAIVLIISFINCIIIYSAQKGSLSSLNVVPLVIGIFFAFIGNVMHSLKPNYFAGIRTPWTLESEETWRKTHQFASKLWFVGGVIMAIASLLMPPSFTSIFMIGIIIILSVIPIAYSYKYYKSIEKS